MDQNTIGEESKEIKFNRGLDLFIESLLKPDPKLRACAYNQDCYLELNCFSQIQCFDSR